MSESSNLKTPPNKRNKENDLSIALDALNCLPEHGKNAGLKNIAKKSGSNQKHYVCRGCSNYRLILVNV